jgi:tetratricopeptide (TPR) repeat protein
VLEGSVRRYAQRIRIAAQLVGAQDQSHLWAREYDRQLSDVLTLQSEIAETIAGELQVALGANWERPTVVRSRPLSPQSYKAYDLYLRGRYYWNKRTPDGFRKALEVFQQATENDPGYARAYAGLADSYAMMSNYGFAPATDCMPQARAAALKALQIDDSLAEAHTSLAVIAQDYDWDWQMAEKEYRRAIELNANYATAHHWYAEYLAYQGRFHEALAESERARELDPLSLIIAADNGAIFYFSRQYDRAIERFRAVLDMDPGFARAHLVILAYAQKGQFAAALADIRSLAPHRG